MKTFGFITVRTGSSRLPQKALLTIRGKKVIEHVIERAKSIPDLDGVVVCTTTLPEDDVIEAIARTQGVHCYRGSVEDKLERWKEAAQKFEADYVITIDGDDPFCDPELCQAAVRQLADEALDFLQAPEGIACGAFTYGIKTSALSKVCEIKNTSDTEMMWGYFSNTGLFKVGTLAVADPIFLDSTVRLTLDYPEDLEFFRVVFDALSIDENTVPLRDILRYLAANPQVKEINFFRQAEFLENQRRNTHIDLK